MYGGTLFTRDAGLDITGSLTLEAWITQKVSGGHQPFLAKGDTQYALKQTDGTLEFFIHMRRPVDHRELETAGELDRHRAPRRGCLRRRGGHRDPLRRR